MHSTVLIRTLMDKRYFHGIRTAAAQSLAAFAKDEMDWIGFHHLEKAFQEFFCFPGSPMTRSNDFSDRKSYSVQCAIPQAIGQIREKAGHANLRAMRFLLDKLKFNDNSTNEFSDVYYVSTLITALAESLQAKAEAWYDMGVDELEDHRRFRTEALEEIDRYRRMDEWMPSYHNIYSRTTLDCQCRLAKASLLRADPLSFLHYTNHQSYDLVRIHAFDALVELGLFKTPAVIRWLLSVAAGDPSPFVRDALRKVLWKALAIVALGHDEEQEPPVVSDLIVEQESSTDTRQALFARRQTIEGALEALKAAMRNNESFGDALWSATTSSEIGLLEIADFLDVCHSTFDPFDDTVVVLKYPRYWEVANRDPVRYSYASLLYHH